MLVNHLARREGTPLGSLLGAPVGPDFLKARTHNPVAHRGTCQVQPLRALGSTPAWLLRLRGHQGESAHRWAPARLRGPAVWAPRVLQRAGARRALQLAKASGPRWEAGWTPGRR